MPPYLFIVVPRNYLFTITLPSLSVGMSLFLYFSLVVAFLYFVLALFWIVGALALASTRSYTSALSSICQTCSFLCSHMGCLGVDVDN